jgi:hypothetical protein
LPILWFEPRSGDDRVGDQGRFCNVVGDATSPLLANVYLDRLDRFVEQALLPEFTKGERKRTRPGYDRLTSRMQRLKAKGASEGDLRPIRE